MDTITQGPLRAVIIDSDQFLEEFTVPGPVFLPLHIDEGGEVVRRVVAHIFVVALFGHSDEVVGDSLVNPALIFEGGNERSNV